MSLVDGLFGQFKTNNRLDKLSELIDWKRLEKLIAPLRHQSQGRPGYAPILLLKCLLLAQWYNLSDPQTEEAVNDRISFRRFVGLSMDEFAPDHSTLSRFRMTLIQHNLSQWVFDEVLAQIEAHGLILKKGTLIDATIVEGSENDADTGTCGFKKQRGYKLHVAADEGSGVIRKVEFTSANVHDSQGASGLVLGDEEAVYADKAYDNKSLKSAIKNVNPGIKIRILKRIFREHHSLTRQWIYGRMNRVYQRIRRGVERVFGTLKRSYGYWRVRYRGYLRNKNEAYLRVTAFNLMKLCVTLG